MSRHALFFSSGKEGAWRELITRTMSKYERAFGFEFHFPERKIDLERAMGWAVGVSAALVVAVSLAGTYITAMPN